VFVAKRKELTMRTWQTSNHTITLQNNELEVRGWFDGWGEITSDPNGATTITLEIDLGSIDPSDGLPRTTDATYVGDGFWDTLHLMMEELERFAEEERQGEQDMEEAMRLLEREMREVGY
jgi:hypothetical protein